jgi:hypothetical protein
VYAKTARILLEGMYQPYGHESSMAHMPITLAGGYEPFLYGVQEFLDHPDHTPPGIHVWLRRVAIPMWTTWRHYCDKQNPHRWNNARDAIQVCGDMAWRKAVEEWLKRRHFASFTKAQQS